MMIRVFKESFHEFKEYWPASHQSSNEICPFCEKVDEFLRHGRRVFNFDRSCEASFLIERRTIIGSQLQNWMHTNI